jgi:GNAT superfamily N-acetyltransferase
VIVVRTVENDADIDTYLDVRNRVHPETPMPRGAVLDQRRHLESLDLIAELDGVSVGAASVSKFGGSPDGELAYLTLRVLREARRQGVGTALHRRASEYASTLGKRACTVSVRDDDADSLGYYAARRFEEVGRMQDVRLDLSTAEPEPQVPAGIQIVAALTPVLERGAYAVALEADADIPAGVPIESGPFDRWRERHFGSRTLPDLSFVAIEDGRVVGYAILGRHTDEAAQHWMTGVARAARGRGIALALKQAQIAAAKAAGWRYLDTQNDLGNAPMRRVNEKLGYVRKFDWVHLTGPLLEG